VGKRKQTIFKKRWFDITNCDTEEALGQQNLRFFHPVKTAKESILSNMYTYSVWRIKKGKESQIVNEDICKPFLFIL
jgi:hypothetical protein